MTKKFLTSTYKRADPDQARAHYDDWATSYDAEIAENGYATPARVAEALARHAPGLCGPLLDFGCGTGLSGVALRAAGFTTIDGADLSADMLKGAAEKGAYRKLWQIEATDPVPGGYDLITATGVIGIGAAPASTFDVLLGALSSGGLLAMSLNDHTRTDPEFDGRWRAALDAGTARLLFQEYGVHLPGIDLKSTVYVFEKT